MARSKAKSRQISPASTAARPATPQPMPHQASHQSQTIFAQKFHQGPLPSREEFDGYERTLPGAADRILCLAEKQAQHRQIIESNSLLSDTDARTQQQYTEHSRIAGLIWNERIGQIFGFLVAAGCLGGATWGMIHGASVGTIALFLGLPIAGVIKAFLPKSASEKRSK